MHERLTSLSHGAGCACKMPLGQLEQMLAGLVHTPDPRLLVGPDLGDDGAVWDLGNGMALIATTDFFTPIVDDPHDWGRIAAANAASDVFAMGGEPLFALNIVGWPKGRGTQEIAAAMAGAQEVASGGGWSVVGGHTIDLGEPIFGQAVVGLVKAQGILTNAGAAAGDALVLTKPLGTGIVMTAAKREPLESVAPGGWLHPAHAAAVDSMTRLNRDAAMAAGAAGATAVTDVTGFGLLGHLHRLALASGVAAVLNAVDVPTLGGVADLIGRGFVPGGTRTNLDYARDHLDAAVADPELIVLADAQTSGGLLATVPASAADGLVTELARTGHQAARIGHVTKGRPGHITVR